MLELKATEDLYGACPNIPIMIGDVEIDQHFFVQDSTPHPIIFGQPYITSSRMETRSAKKKEGEETS